jgi:hypothetical protein
MTAIRVDASTLYIEFPGWEAIMTGRSRFDELLVSAIDARDVRDALMTAVPR